MDEKTQAAKRRGDKTGRGGRITVVLLVLLLLIGVGVAAYPAVSDWWNDRKQDRAIAGYEAAADGIEAETAARMLEEAQAYNRTLLQKENRFQLDEEDIAVYESLLDVTGTGIMGFIQIPAIGVDLPVYHGTDEDVVQVAIGHIEPVVAFRYIEGYQPQAYNLTRTLSDSADDNVFPFVYTPVTAE